MSTLHPQMDKLDKVDKMDKVDKVDFWDKRIGWMKKRHSFTAETQKAKIMSSHKVFTFIFIILNV